MKNDEIEALSSSPQARGERVRRLRNLANLSRQALCSNGDFKIDTLIGWEVARHGGLTKKGAEKLIHRLEREGIVCSLEWLMYEGGPGPMLITDFNKKHIIEPGEENTKIATELLVFKNHYDGALALCIPDNSMEPQYNQGDYIAGVSCTKDKWSMLPGHDCIIQLTSGSLILRKVLSGEDNTYTVAASNLKSGVQQLVMTNITFADAAPVMWHRRKYIF